MKPTAFDTICSDCIELTQLLRIHNLKSGEGAESIQTTLIAIPQDKTLPCSFTLELEVDGKSIDEFVNVSGKLGGLTAKNKDIAMTFEDGSRKKECLKTSNMGPVINKHGCVIPILISPKNKSQGLSINDLKAITLRIKNTQNIDGVYPCTVDTKKTEVTDYSSALESYDSLDSLVRHSDMETSKEYEWVRAWVCVIPKNLEQSCSFSFALERGGKSLEESIDIICRSQFADDRAAKQEFDFSQGSEELLQNHYQVLGISSSATPPQIKKKYYQLAKQDHPDKNPGDVANATIKFQKIDLAYKVLSDTVNRTTWHKRRTEEGMPIN